MTTPFKYCVICDGYGGNGAPCGRCGKDSGSPLRLAEEKSEQLQTWGEWIKNVVKLSPAFSQQGFRDLAENTRKVCDGCAIVSFYDDNPGVCFEYCLACHNAEIRE